MCVRISPLTYNETENKRFISYRKFNLTVTANVSHCCGNHRHILVKLYSYRLKAEAKVKIFCYFLSFCLFFDLFSFLLPFSFGVNRSLNRSTQEKHWQKTVPCVTLIASSESECEIEDFLWSLLPLNVNSTSNVLTPRQYTMSLLFPFRLVQIYDFTCRGRGTKETISTVNIRTLVLPFGQYRSKSNGESTISRGGTSPRVRAENYNLTKFLKLNRERGESLAPSPGSANRWFHFY